MISLFLCIMLISQSLAKTDLYVGFEDKVDENSFKSVQEAVDKAASINPKSEEERIIIHIAPGTYRQQVVVNTPYITFKNDDPTQGDSILTWYYGIGYKYYSANEDGLYDATLAQKKLLKIQLKNVGEQQFIFLVKQNTFKQRTLFLKTHLIVI